MDIPVKRHGDALWFTAIATGLDGVEAQWDLWTGTWAIVDNVSVPNVTKLSGDLTRGVDMGKFYVHVGSTQMSSLTPGSYLVVCKARCESVDYGQEFAHERLVIEKAGIPV